MALPEPAPRNLPKNEDPKLVNRNRRMLGNLLGTLEVFFYITWTLLFCSCSLVPHGLAFSMADMSFVYSSFS